MKKIFIVALVCSLCLVLSACSDGLCDICGATADIEGEQKELCTKCLMKEASDLVSEGLNGLYEGLAGESKEEKDCSSCGKSISKDASFCEHCGAATSGEQASAPFETLSFSGKGQKAFSGINVPAGNYVLVGTATINGDRYSFSSFDVELKDTDHPYAAWWVGSVSGDNKSVEKMEPFQGPINGGVLEVEAEDSVSWTITIEAA